MTQRRFLTAEWKNLLMLNYAVDAEMLQRYVPAGTELDRFAGKFYVSLIGFEFNHTRIAGARVPFHQSFEEVNLRLYVRRGERRGVVFIRELVPKRAVVAIARAVFGENYACARMSHLVEMDVHSGDTTAKFSFGSGSDLCSMHLETIGEPLVPADESLAQFITEHYWGYARSSDGTTLEYEVQHPRWRVWGAKDAGFRGDATAFYGAEFAKVLERPPDSAFLAEGSAVTVFRGTRIQSNTVGLV